MPLHDDAHWVRFNASQGDRPVRPLCHQAMQLHAPGTAIDLGCGSGRETRALLDAGWRVHAVDASPDTRAVVLRTIGGIHSRLTLDASPFAALFSLPPADLIYAGYSLPYQSPESFQRVWALLRAALRPGGVLAVNLFGDHDSWAGEKGMTFLTEETARLLFDGLEIVTWDEEDADGPAFSGPKHWHVFDVIARAPGCAGRQPAGSSSETSSSDP
jgi:trans-aconitate methyltransferase